MGGISLNMSHRDEAQATEALKTLFGKVDLDNNGKLSVSELKRVFGDHAEQFLQFCDNDDDKAITEAEWLKGILGDTADMSEEEFQLNWVDRMNACVAEAPTIAQTNRLTLDQIVALTSAQLVTLGLSEDLAAEKVSLFVAAASRLLAMGISGDTPANGFYVPGRIEVMGKHTDYAGGRSLLAAASKSFCVVSTDREDNVCRIFTNRTGSTDPAELAAMAACTEDSDNQATLTLSPELTTDSAWANYPAMTLRRLCRNFGELQGVDMAIECDIPEASGMSTSSAMICTMFVVMDARNNLQEKPAFKENLKSKEDFYGYLGCCENGQNFNDALTGDKGVGTFGGSEDHTAIMSCTSLSLNMFSYCPTLFLGNVQWPEDLTFVIASSGAVAEKTGAAMGSYNNAAFLARDCTRAWNKSTSNTAAFLAQACTQIEGSHEEKLEAMSAEIAKFDKGEFPEVDGEPKWSEGVLVPRFEQFYRESEVLVPQFAEALKANDHAALSAVAAESQDRTDNQLKNLVPETQWLPKAAMENGAVAASAFGAGFGGSVWAIVQKAKADEFKAAWQAAYEGKFEAAKNPACRFFSMVPGPGAFSLQGQRWSVDA